MDISTAICAAAQVLRDVFRGTPDPCFLCWSEGLPHQGFPSAEQSQTQLQHGSGPGCDACCMVCGWLTGVTCGVEQSTVACTLGGRDCILLSSVLFPCCGSDNPCLPVCSFSASVAASFSSCQAERSVSPAFPLSPAPCPPQGCRAPGPGCSSSSSDGFQQAGSHSSGCAAFAPCSGPCLALMF